MPIETTRLERGIYRLTITGKMTMEELAANQEVGLQIVTEHGETRHVLIMDFQPGASVPVDVRGARRVYEGDDGRLQALYMVNAPRGLEVIVSAFQRLLGLPFVLCATVDEAVEKARVLLAEKSES